MMLFFFFFYPKQYGHLKQDVGENCSVTAFPGRCLHSLYVSFFCTCKFSKYFLALLLQMLHFLGVHVCTLVMDIYFPRCYHKLDTIFSCIQHHLFTPKNSCWKLEFMLYARKMVRACFVTYQLNPKVKSAAV